MSDRFFVLTGGPGSGKTSVLQALAARGFDTMPEAGRAVIRDQAAIGGALPWADRALFAEQMLAWDMRSHAEAAGRSRPVFFDRGIPDLIGYLTLCGLPVPAHLERAAARFRYHARVFAFPYWPAIFTRDAERRQSPQEAEATFRAVTDAYRACGYELVAVPKLTIDERADFILSETGPAA